MPNVYEIITEKIISQLDQGTAPWRKPWRTEMPMNLISGKEYRGINPFLLAPQGYGSRFWLTYNQANKLGGNVRKGEKSSIVTFWHAGEEKTTTGADGIARKSKPFLLRYYHVFNVEQCNGLDSLGLDKAPARVPDLERCEQIIANMPNRPAMAQHAQASYRPSTDTVSMPSKTAFESSEGFYSTLFHEMSHSTGHPSRVGREGIEQLNAFGIESYSKEELVAELGAAMLCGITGIEPATIQNSASYLQSWIRVLKGDVKLIVQAASAAQKAADFILGKSAKSEQVSTESVVL
jgi:antirestriction protein ArdC